MFHLVCDKHKLVYGLPATDIKMLTVKFVFMLHLK